MARAMLTTPLNVDFRLVLSPTFLLFLVYHYVWKYKLRRQVLQPLMLHVYTA